MCACVCVCVNVPNQISSVSSIEINRQADDCSGRFNTEDVENITVIFSVDFYQSVTNFRTSFSLP